MSVNTLMCYVKYCGNDISLPAHCVTFSICKNANSVTKLLIRWLFKRSYFYCRSGHFQECK